MSAAVCGKRAASFFEDQKQQQQLLPHATASPPPPSKRARFRGGWGNLSPPRPRGSGADPGLVDAIQARLPAASIEFIEKALEECGNDLDSATKLLLNRHVESVERNVALQYQSPVGMSTGGQVPTGGILEDSDTAAPIGSVPYAESLPSSSTQWVDILVNEMAAASNTDDARARASRVLEVFERFITSRTGAEPLQSFQKVDTPSEENSVYKEQFEAVMKENTILKKAVAIQHERQKEHEERSQELQQLKQLVVQYQEQVRSLEVNNYALSMHLRQAQQSNSIPGHFNRHIF